MSCVARFTVGVRALLGPRARNRIERVVAAEAAISFSPIGKADGPSGGPAVVETTPDDQLFPRHVSTLAVNDPELIEIFDNFAFDEVLQWGP